MGMVNHRREMHRVAVWAVPGLLCRVTHVLSSLDYLACLTAYSLHPPRDCSEKEIQWTYLTHHLITYSAKTALGGGEGARRARGFSTHYVSTAGTDVAMTDECTSHEVARCTP